MDGVHAPQGGLPGDETDPFGQGKELPDAAHPDTELQKLAKGSTFLVQQGIYAEVHRRIFLQVQQKEPPRLDTGQDNRAVHGPRTIDVSTN